MSSSELSKKLVIIQGIASLSLFLMVFFFLLGLDFPLSTALTISFLAYFLIYLGLFLQVRYSLHSRIIGPLRVFLLSSLSSITILKWNISIEVDEEGNALVTNEYEGKVNFGSPRWMTIGIWAGSPQSGAERFSPQVQDIDTQTTPIFEFIAVPGYKKIRIRFDRELKRGDRFHHRVQHRLQKAFYFDRMDYYSFQASENTREISIAVAVPPTAKIKGVYGEVQTQYGESIGESGMSYIASPQLVSWKFKRALSGNLYILRWLAERM